MRFQVQMRSTKSGNIVELHTVRCVRPQGGHVVVSRTPLRPALQRISKLAVRRAGGRRERSNGGVGTRPVGCGLGLCP
jgi:hypothetical protein